MTKLSNLIKTLIVTPRFYETMALVIVILGVVAFISTFFVNIQNLAHEIDETLSKYPRGDAAYSTSPVDDILESSFDLALIIIRHLWQVAVATIHTLGSAIVAVAVCVCAAKFLRTHKRS